MTEQRILHLTANYPDGQSPGPKTPAVRNLLACVPDFRHTVVSVTRVFNPLRAQVTWNGDVLVARYFALPRAFAHQFFMRRLARRICRALRERNVEYQAVHAHKLTVEGLVLDGLRNCDPASFAHMPSVVSVRPFTDFPLMRRSFRVRERALQVLGASNAVVYLAPWAKQYMDDQFGAPPTGVAYFLPNAVASRIPASDILPTAELNRFVTVLRAGQHRQKRFAAVAEALSRLEGRFAATGLDVFGGGDQAILQRIAARFGVAGRIRLRGKIPNEALMGELTRYKALVLPSYFETFGMVYAEALSAGIPVILGRGFGISGYFEPDLIGAEVSSDNVQELRAAMTNLLEHNDDFRARIRKLRESGELDIFSGENMRSTYIEILQRVID